jgi:tetratricopeptide (TPR) repeat protein
MERGRRALLAAGDDPTILANSALALGYFGEDIASMIRLADRALALNPNFARGWHVSGLLRFWGGEPDAAIERVENSMRLSPRARVGFGLAVIAWCHFVSRRFEEAVPRYRLAIQEDPMPTTLNGLTACLAQMGRLEEAHAIYEQIPPEMRGLSVSHAHSLRNPEHRELFLSGLRLATGKEPIQH